MITYRKFGSVLMVAGLAACTVGPRFKAPTPELGSVVTTDVVTNDAWWHEFHDAELDQLEERTQKGNLDLQAGLLRILEARTQVQASRAQGLPSLKGTASYNREQLGAAGILKAQGGTFGGTALSPALTSLLTTPINLYQVGFDASWELDLFGKVRRTVEEAEAKTDQAIESRNDMLVSLEAEVAQNYMQLRAAQYLRSITLGLIDDEKQILDLTISRRQHGLAGDTDVESARAQVASLQSQLPQYDQTIATSRHGLAVLIGQTPETLDAELGPVVDLPSLPQMNPAGVPSTLARRRPDIRQAEATLHAQTANIGIAMASMYPDVSLSGTFGLRNLSTSYLFNWASKFYTLGPTVSVPLFQGGALVANVKMARAEAEEAALNYRKVVLSALQDVEDGLVSLDQDGLRATALKETVAADQRSFDITLQAYKVGLTNYIAVLNLELQTNQAKQQLAQASLTEITDLVKLYKALGGGWQTDAVSVAASSGPGSAKSF